MSWSSPDWQLQHLFRFVRGVERLERRYAKVRDLPATKRGGLLAADLNESEFRRHSQLISSLFNKSDQERHRLLADAVVTFGFRFSWTLSDLATEFRERGWPFGQWLNETEKLLNSW